MANKSEKFGIGLVVGTIIGGIAALFLSPKSGKQNRDMVVKKMKELQTFIDDQEVEVQAKKIFGEVNDKTKKLYKQLQKQTKAKVGEMNDAIEELDVDKYKKQVTGILADLKKDGAAEEMVLKAKKYLMTFVDKVSDTVKEKVDEVIPEKTEKKTAKK